MHSTIRLPSSKPDSLSPPQGIFALQKSLRGDCGGAGVPSAVGNSSPRAKKFPEEICFAPSRVLQICRTPRLAVAQKYVTTPDWSHVRVGQPQGARGTTVPLFREASRGTPSKRFLWATSSRRLDTALLFADKKRGVETYQAGRALPVNPWSLDHGSSKKATCCGAGSKALAAGRQQKNRRTFVRRFSLPYLLLYALMPRASRSMARSSLSCLRM